MKTSKKLLISFIGLITVMLLICNLVLWANYKRGINGDRKMQLDLPKVTGPIDESVPAFSVLKVVGGHHVSLYVFPEDSNRLKADGFYGDKPYNWTVQHDTLLVRTNESVTLYVHETRLSTIIAQLASIQIDNMEQPSLNVQVGDSSRLELVKLKVKHLQFAAGSKSEFTVHEESAIDSLDLTLGKGGELKMMDVPVKYSNIKVDSLKNLELKGRSALQLTQIK
jgi:hypothetical protein